MNRIYSKRISRTSRKVYFQQVFYLIDGSNLLGSIGELGAESSELKLLAKIDRYCIVHGHNALVVFDAMDARDAGSSFPYGQKTKVRIPYEREGRDRADRVLVAEARKRKSERPRIVVTDDRVLASKVAENGTTVLPSGEFMRLLSRQIQDRDTMSTEKELAARGIDNAELLKIWLGEQPGEDEGF
jgi:predicted RNA-binding protein with PIN domain